MYETILLDVESGIGCITINHPKTLNALSEQIVEEFSDAMATLEADDSVRVVIVTGTGKAFVAGADIAVMAPFSPEQARRFAATTNGLCRRMKASKKVYIAAVNGFALGGGCELMLGCDICIAAENAKLGLPEVSLGVLPGGGGTQRMTRLVGTKKALELILTADRISAQEALEIGLINRVVPAEELLPYTREMAGRIMKNAPLAVQYAKECVHQSDMMDLEAGLDFENTMFGLCFATADQKEGMGAFLEKRPPNFTGKL